VAYTVHPYRRPVIGWMDDIQNEPPGLVDFYKLYYAPGNSYIVVTGDFHRGDLTNQAAFRKFRAAPPECVPKAAAARRQVILKKEAELPFILMYYHAPNLKSPDNYALDLLSVVLAGGRSSRLYHELVYKKRIARNIDADYSGVSIDPTGFSVTGQLMPGKESAEVEREMTACWKNGRINQRARAAEAKNQIESSYIYAQDSIFGRR
jgi:zinc protease